MLTSQLYPRQLQDSWAHWNPTPFSLLLALIPKTVPALGTARPFLKHSVSPSPLPNCQAFMNSKFWQSTSSTRLQIFSSHDSPCPSHAPLSQQAYKAFAVLARDLIQPFSPCLSSISLWFPLPAPRLHRTPLSVPTQDTAHGMLSSQWDIHRPLPSHVHCSSGLLVASKPFDSSFTQKVESERTDS